jgi:hypothetical protein
MSTKWLALGLVLGCAQAAVANDSIENLFRGKLGRNTPMEERRLEQERASAAFRAEPVLPAQAYVDQYSGRKLGRNTPMEETRLEQERASSAFRAEPAPPAVPYMDQFMRQKLGRTGR